MSSGSYLGDGTVDIGSRPGDFNAWEKFQLGWLNYEVAFAGAKSEHKLGPAEANTKQAQVIAMLCSPSGATIDAMMRMTGWQQHSVRGFLASVVRKKLGLDLRSEPAESGRLYRINDRAASSPIDTRAKTAA